MMVGKILLFIFTAVIALFRPIESSIILPAQGLNLNANYSAPNNPPVHLDKDLTIRSFENNAELCVVAYHKDVLTARCVERYDGQVWRFISKTKADTTTFSLWNKQSKSCVDFAIARIGATAELQSCDRPNNNQLLATSKPTVENGPVQILKNELCFTGNGQDRSITLGRCDTAGAHILWHLVYL